MSNTNYIKAKKRKNGSLIEDYGENHPKDAYVILGHGNEGWKLKEAIKEGDSEEEQERKKKDIEPDLIKVPKGSIVVIKSHPGDVTSDNDTMIHYSNVIAKENEKYVLDPITYIDEITKIFGSVSIFREGDLCPNIGHRFISDFKNEGMPIRLEPSGIVKIPLKEPVNFKEARLYMGSKISIPLDMTVKEYKEQRDKGGFSIEGQLKLHSGPTGVNLLLNTLIEKLEDKDNQEKKMNEFYNDTFSKFVLDQNDFFKNRPNSITYAFNCRYIKLHEHYVPEHVRLGVKSSNNLKGIVNYKVNYGSQPRNEHNYTTNIEGLRKNFKNKDKLLKASIKYADLPNNSLNLAKTRKRVKNMAPEIKQEISESVLQRKLGAVAASKKNRNANKINGLLKEYSNDFTMRNHYDGTYKQAVINKLEKIYPGIEKRHFNNVINGNSRNISTYRALRGIKNRYANRKNNITKKIKLISNSFINKNVNSMNTYNRNTHKKALELILNNNSTRKNNINNQLSKLHAYIVNDILNSEIYDFEALNKYKILNKLGDKTDQKVKDKLKEIMALVYDSHKSSMNLNLPTEEIANYMKLNKSDDSELIEYLQKRREAVKAKINKE